MDFAAWKDRKGVAQALKTVYRAVDANAGQAALEDFAEGPWGAKYPAIAQSWCRNWNLVIPFFAFPEGVRRIIYTTDEVDKRFFSWSRTSILLFGCAAGHSSVPATDLANETSAHHRVKSPLTITEMRT